METVRLIECFNFTWQGEGPDAGKKMILLRFKRCNRNCYYCDTNVKMRISSEAEYSIKEIQELIDESNLGVLISGGEPTFGLNLNGTINIINNTKSYLYNVETNGYNLTSLIDNVNKDKNVMYILSPKLFTEKDYNEYVKLVDRIKDNKNVILKIVYQNTEIINMFITYLNSIKFDNNRIWLMPEGKTREELIANSPIVFDIAEKNKFNISSRNHIIYNFI